MNDKVTLGALAAVLCLSACSNAESGSETSTKTATLYCATINGNGAQTVSSVDDICTICSVSDADMAADDDARTFASISDPVSEGGAGASIRSTAPAGAIFPAGSQAGAFLNFPNDFSGANVAHVVTIRTYAGGALQEEASSSEQFVLGKAAVRTPAAEEDGLPHEFVSFTTSKPFDAVEVYADSYGIRWGAPAVYKIHGLCSDGSVTRN